MTEFRIKDAAKWYGLAAGALFPITTTYMRVKFVFDSGAFAGTSHDLYYAGNPNLFIWIIMIAEVAGLDGFDSFRVRFLPAFFTRLYGIS